jgi:hypothetical protein
MELDANGKKLSSLLAQLTLVLVVLTAKGIPDQASRHIAWRIATELRLQAFSLVDFNTGGLLVSSVWERYIA